MFLALGQSRSPRPGTRVSALSPKVRIYVRSHEDGLSVQKLLRNKQITSADIDHLVQVFLENGFGTEKDIERAEEEHGGLGLFLRSLTGLQRSTSPPYSL